jgi:hypothetical protein
MEEHFSGIFNSHDGEVVQVLDSAFVKDHAPAASDGHKRDVTRH